jgi:hypothetical protein
MLQYLINTTSIWLISLVLFDLFLKKESYHGYNRFYLLVTFLLGIFVPLLSWGDGSGLHTSPLSAPVAGVIAAKQTIVTSVQPSAAPGIGWQFYMVCLYFSGVVAALFLLAAEIIKIARLYSSGKKSRAGACIIIETGKNHGPFSLFHYVFVSSRQRYTNEEWDIIMAHEQLHGLLFHFIDVLVLQAARIVFWFHPLVYIYQKKLLLVHEYQADKACGTRPAAYGRFLVEQALLQAAPSLTHSFNRSPIKNRIVMLTRRSSAASKTKMLLFMPLALVCILCFSKNAFSRKPERKGNLVIYKGNKFDLSKTVKDTILLTDPITAKQTVHVATKEPQPIKMNGEKIYDGGETDAKPLFAAGKEKLQEYIINSLKGVAASLPDGDYSLYLKNIIVDKSGKVVYFEDKGMISWKADSKAFLGMKQTVLAGNDILAAIDRMMDEMPGFTPASNDNVPVNSMLSMLIPKKKLVVSNHIMSIADAE